jgi:hypothetical protein
MEGMQRNTRRRRRKEAVFDVHLQEFMFLCKTVKPFPGLSEKYHSLADSLASQVCYLRPKGTVRKKRLMSVVKTLFWQSAEAIICLLWEDPLAQTEQFQHRR